MKVNQLIEKTLNKWQIKLICLGVAIFLYVFHQVSLVDTKTFTVPLHINEEGSTIHVNDVQKYISVIIKADRDELSSIHVNDINAYVNLEYQVETGVFDFPINVELTERMLALDPMEIRIKPENISITCENKITKFIPVEASFVGDVAYGYEISEFSIEPGIISITGPESIVNKTTKFQTTQVDISGINKNLTTRASYVSPNPVLTFDKQVVFDIEVNVLPIISEKTYTNIPVAVKNLPVNFDISSVIPTIDFTVSGTLNYLDNFILSSDVVQIDLSKITEVGDYELPLKIILPKGLTLISKSDEKIMVEVTKFNNISFIENDASVSE